MNQASFGRRTLRSDYRSLEKLLFLLFLLFYFFSFFGFFGVFQGGVFPCFKKSCVSRKVEKVESVTLKSRN